MTHRASSAFVAAVLALAAMAAPALAKDKAIVNKVGDNLVEVTVIGQGMNEEEAKRDAQRQAIEEGAGAFIYSQSQTKDFALVKDTILARSAGFVQSCELIGKPKEVEDGVVAAKYKIVVSVKGIEDLWGVVTNLLQQMGRPKIMVFINEKIGDEVVEDSTVQTRIENALLKNGFLLVDKNQLKEIDKKDLQSAVADDNPAKVQAIAKRFGAQLFISGSAHAEIAEQKEIYGVPHHVYQAEANVKCYRSDTAQLMSSIPGESTTGVDRAARTAAKKALDLQAQQIVPQTVTDVCRFWMDVMEGRGEIQLHVENITFKDYVALKKALETMKEIKQVNAKFSNGIAECSLQSDVTAEVLAEKIVGAFNNLEISDVSANVIKAKYTGSGN